MGDESQIILFNTKGRNIDEVSDELQHFFGYFEESTDEYVSTITDESIIELHERVVQLKKSRELEAGYMKFEDYLKSHGRRERMALLKENINEVLEIKGISSDEIKQKIEDELNPDTLNKWFTASVKAETQEEFIKNM